MQGQKSGNKYHGKWIEQIEGKDGREYEVWDGELSLGRFPELGAAIARAKNPKVPESAPKKTKGKTK